MKQREGTTDRSTEAVAGSLAGTGPRRARPDDGPAPVFTSFSRDCYISTESYERELEAIFFRQWLYVGHESQLERAGDFVTREVADESIIVTRDGKGALNALFNVCRHRGARFCLESHGRVERFVCPYHQWTYALDGRLLRAPAMASSVDRSTLPLQRAHVESWNGLVFLNLSEDHPEPLARLLDPANEAFARYEPRRCKVADSITYDVSANWKLVLENFVECYHCAGAHPEFCRTFDLKGFFASVSAGGNPFESPRTLFHYGSLPMKAGSRSLTVTGEPVCRRLMGALTLAELPANVGMTLYPTSSAVFFGDYGIVFDFQPLGIERTRVCCQWLVAAEAEEGLDYDVDSLVALWDVTNRQDWALCELTQQGVRSRRYLPGPIAVAREPGIREFVESYYAMLDEATATTPAGRVPRTAG